MMDKEPRPWNQIAWMGSTLRKTINLFIITIMIIVRITVLSTLPLLTVINPHNSFLRYGLSYPNFESEEIESQNIMFCAQV